MPNIYIYGNGRNDDILRFVDGKLELSTVKGIKILNLKKIEAIFVFGDIQVTRDCIQKLLMNKISVIFLSSRGDYFGKLISTNNTDIHKQRLQFERGEDFNFCLELSKIILKGKITNQCNFIQKKNEKLVSPLPYLQKISLESYLTKIEVSSTID